MRYYIEYIEYIKYNVNTLKAIYYQININALYTINYVNNIKSTLNKLNKRRKIINSII